MALVKVWNDHTQEHVEKFKNQTIRIAAGGYVEMDYIDAIDFKGQFFGMRMLGPNNPDPKCFKMIRVEEPSEPVVKADPNVLHATGKVMSSPAEVLQMAKAIAALNPDLVATDKDLDAKQSSLAAENAKLRAELAALQERKKPGPKPKERAMA
jgi:hypothetical protein